MTTMSHQTKNISKVREIRKKKNKNKNSGDLKY